MNRYITLIILSLLLTINIQAQKRISREYHNVSLSDALKQLSEQQTDYTIYFLYNELEYFRITTTIKNKHLPEAIQQMIGFYPIRVTTSTEEDGRKIFVECTHKTDLHLTGNIIDEQGQPVAYANIALLNPVDSTVLCGGVSNEAGVFVIPFSQPEAIVRISYIGYKTFYHVYNKENVGTIRMQPKTQRLKGITVEGKSPILRREAGTIIFDTRHIAGAINATDLLRYTPGVIIEDDNVNIEKSVINKMMTKDIREYFLNSKAVIFQSKDGIFAPKSRVTKIPFFNASNPHEY